MTSAPTTAGEQLPGEPVRELLAQAPRSLDELLARLPITSRPTLMGGGSNARVFEFDHAGQRCVVKFVRTGTELVDGHDALTLARKADQIALIHRACPRLASRVVAPLVTYRGDDGCALVMRRETGHPLPTLLAETGDPGQFFAVLAPILTELVEHGYSTSVTAAPPGTFTRLHLDRIERRLPVLRAHLGADLLDGHLRVNGHRCPRLEDLLASLRARASLLAAVDPPALHFPAHGDLNADNLFYRDDGYFVLDPRGTTEHWDAMYDMSKLLFSLSGLHTGMRSGFDIGAAPGAIEVDVRSGQTAAFESAADHFAAFLAGLPVFDRLIEADPHWLLRLHLGTAMHMLAEVACRFSDTKRDHAARVELATGLYAMGILTATQLLEREDAELLNGPVPRPRWRRNRAADRGSR